MTVSDERTFSCGLLKRGITYCLLPVNHRNTSQSWTSMQKRVESTRHYMSQRKHGMLLPQLVAVILLGRAGWLLGISKKVIIFFATSCKP